jgi:hypothetical protein
LKGGKNHRKKMRKPRLRWTEYVDDDLRRMKMKRWRQKANTLNREEWISVVKDGQGSRRKAEQGVSKYFQQLAIK